MDLKGRGAIITGASRGLGAALARSVAAAGARVALVARGEEALQAVARSIREAGGEAHVIAADVGAKRDAHRIAGTAAALLGEVDLLVHDASALGPVPLRPLLDTDCEALEATLQTNLVGPFRLTKIVAGAMALRARGLVLHITSDASVVPYPGWGAYGVSKAALDHLARIWAAELADTGVRLLSVDPGEMNTRMHAEAMPDADPSTLADPAVVAARIVGIIQRAEQFASGARLELACPSEAA
jgi:NAD(P)-dependent dehydrogenase (short-subunit alcohol dehydrogenase family)